MRRMTPLQLRSGEGCRRGALSVEFALVAPLLLLLTFAAVEFARLNMLVNSMENAAYEGARRGIIPGANADQVRSEAGAILTAVGAVGSDVTVMPATISQSTPDVTVTIRVPLNDNAWITPRFTSNLVLERTCKLTRERTSNP